MKQGFTISSIRKRHARLVRAVAVFFVLFTLCDIALPQYFCGGGEEVGGLPPSSIRHGRRGRTFRRSHARSPKSGARL